MGAFRRRDAELTVAFKLQEVAKYLGGISVRVRRNPRSLSALH